MKLIGMLDSPFVRRVAISAKLLDLPFEHESLSVFRHVEQFRAINPVVKAPTLVTDDGATLMDSSLIVDYLDHRVAPARRLLPEDAAARLNTLVPVGFALAAAEKSVQVVYEQALRPADKTAEARKLDIRAAVWSPLESTAIALNVRVDFIQQPQHSLLVTQVFSFHLFEVLLRFLHLAAAKNYHYGCGENDEHGRQCDP